MEPPARGRKKALASIPGADQNPKSGGDCLANRKIRCQFVVWNLPAVRIYGLQSCTSRFPLEPVQTDIVEIVDCGGTSVLHTALTVTGRKLLNLILAQQQSIENGGFGLKHRSI